MKQITVRAVELRVNGPRINRANVVFISCILRVQLMVVVRLFVTLSDEVEVQAENGQL